MKYILILAAVVVIVRIDWVLRLFDKTSTKFGSSQSVVVSEDVQPADAGVSFKNDPTITQSPRNLFFAMVQNFITKPDQQMRDNALDVLRKNPTIIPVSLDKELEGVLEKFRELLRQKNAEAAKFLIELAPMLHADNSNAVKAALSTLIDVDLGEFLTLYHASQDTNCAIATVQGDQISEEEKFNELIERAKAFDLYLASDKLDPLIKPFAVHCQLVLKLYLDKIRANFVPVEAVPLAPETVPASEVTQPVPSEGQNP